MKGHLARIKDLHLLPALNGRVVEVLTDLVEEELIEPDMKLRTAKRHGCAFVTEPDRTGYIAPENLEDLGESTPELVRAVWIAETGTEEPH